MKHLNFEKIIKYLVITFMTLTFVGIMLPDEFVIGIHRLTYNHNEFQMIIRWFNLVSFIVLPIAVFYNRPIFKKIAIYFFLPVDLKYLYMYKLH